MSGTARLDGWVLRAAKLAGFQLNLSVLRPGAHALLVKRISHSAAEPSDARRRRITARFKYMAALPSICMMYDEPYYGSWNLRHVTLTKQLVNVLSPSQHEMQPVTPSSVQTECGNCECYGLWKVLELSTKHYNKQTAAGRDWWWLLRTGAQPALPLSLGRTRLSIQRRLSIDYVRVTKYDELNAAYWPCPMMTTFFLLYTLGLKSAVPYYHSLARTPHSHHRTSKFTPPQTISATAAINYGTSEFTL
eukprot:6192306-Pleurochrysis_carterae.AAC.1